MTCGPGGLRALGLVQALLVVGPASAGAAETAPPTSMGVRLRSVDVAVVPVVSAISREPGDRRALSGLAAELAQRCPGGRWPMYRDVAPLLPQFTAPSASIASAPGPYAASSIARSEAERRESTRQEGDALGVALRAIRAARALEAEPLTLLGHPARRTLLRDSYRTAAHAFLSAGQVQAAQEVLARLAVRLPDQPPASAAQQGPALAALDRQVRKALPGPTLDLTVRGPVGWAVHVDERPLGALPEVQIRLPPGSHAVVVVGSDGTRVTWRLPESADQRVRLLASRDLLALCSLDDRLAVCPRQEPTSAAWHDLAWVLGADLLLLRERAGHGQIWAQRLRADGGVDAMRSESSGDPGALARLCQVASGPTWAPARHEIGQRRERRLWPAALLLSAGAALALSGAPLWIYNGQCVDAGCTRVYDFHGLAPTSLGVGLAIAVGGAVWLGIAAR